MVVSEGNSKAELSRTKKKLEADIRELEIALDRANADICEFQTKVKNQFVVIRDMEQQIEIAKEEKHRLSEIIHATDRKLNSIAIEVEDSRVKYEQSEKCRRQIHLQLKGRWQDCICFVHPSRDHVFESSDDDYDHLIMITIIL